MCSSGETRSCVVPEVVGGWVNDPCRCRAPMPVWRALQGLIGDASACSCAFKLGRRCRDVGARGCAALVFGLGWSSFSCLSSCPSLAVTKSSTLPFSHASLPLFLHPTPPPSRFLWGVQPRHFHVSLVCLLFNCRGCSFCTCPCATSLLRLPLCPFCEALRCLYVVDC